MNPKNFAGMVGAEGRRVGIGMKVLPLFLLPLGAFLLACSAGSEPKEDKASPEPATPTATSGSAAPSIQAVPATGKCGESFEVRGAGFQSGQKVELGFFADLTDAPSLATVTSGADGSFKATVQNSNLFYSTMQCVPGIERVLAVKEADGRTPIRAIYTLAQLGALTVEPKVATCADKLTISGSGFTPGATVWFMEGQTDPMAHNFIKLGEATAEASGSVLFTYTPPAGSPCPFKLDAMIRAWVSGAQNSGVWSATFHYQP